MTEKFKEILSGVDNEVLNESSKQAIIEAFETAVEEKTTARVDLAVNEAVKQMDESHAEKLEKLLEAIDADHTNKLKKVLQKVDADYAEKLEQVIERYENMVKKEAIEFRDQLTTEMSNYMDLYLDNMIPKEQIQEAVENTKSRKVLDQIKSLVSIDEDYITDTIREALTDGKNRISSLQQELTEAVRNNIQINQELKKTRASLILEKKTMDFDENKKRYIVRVLQEKSPEEIEENFDYVVEMFERDEAEEIEILTESATKSVQSKVVDTPEADHDDEQIVESVNFEKSNPIQEYLNVLKEQDR
jgi:DNA-binding protein YbaB